MLRALLQTRTQLAAGAGRLGTTRLMSSTADTQAAPAKSSSLRNFFLALVPIGVMGAVFEKKHLDSMAETEAREAAERAAGHEPPPRVTAAGGTTSHGVEIDPENPLNKLLPNTDCEYCLETRQKIYAMMKHMGRKDSKRAKPKAAAAAAAQEGGTEQAPMHAAAAAAAPREQAAVAAPAAADEAAAPQPAAAVAEPAEAAAAGEVAEAAAGAVAMPVAATAAEPAEAPAAQAEGAGAPPAGELATAAVQAAAPSPQQ